jgi:tetratricopeptide (TPR) repeat protein
LPDVNKSLKLRADDADTLDSRGHIFEAMGRHEEAIADFRRALTNNPDLQASKDALKRLGAGP